MGTRAHVYVALLATSGMCSGCIFGWGSKKEKTSLQTAHLPAVDAVAQRPVPSSDPQVKVAKQARDKVLQDALTPKDTDVEWQTSEHLWLTEREAARPLPEPPAGQEAFAAQAAAAAATAVPRPAQPPATAAPVKQDPSAARAYATPQQTGVSTELTTEPADGATMASQGEAVANAELSLTDADVRHQAAAPVSDVKISSAAAANTPQAVNKEQSSSVAAGDDELSRRVAQRLRDNPGDIAAHLDHQLLRFLTGDSVPDLNTLSTLPAEDRELVGALMDGLSNFRNGVRSDQNMLLSQKVRPLLEVGARLRSQAELSIPTIALCKRVGGFGMYEPMDGRFVAGQQNATIVYCEVGNVSSQQNEQGVWESKLSQEAVLYTEAGLPVWTSQRQTVPDRSRNRRHDFFVGQKLVFPANLPIARYILKVTVTDEQVKRVAEATAPITMVATLDVPQQQQPAPIAAPPAPQAQPAATNAARTASDHQRVQGTNVTSTGVDAVDGK